MKAYINSNKTNMNKKILFLFLTFALCFSSYSQIIYVKKLATGLNNGTSWANAYTDLSVAINNNAAGQIWVGEGTYHPTTDINGNTFPNSRFNTFRLRPDIAIYGGFSGVETELSQRDWVNNPTILSGNVGDPNLRTDNLIHVLSSEYTNLNINTILDGLTIKGGYAVNLNQAAGMGFGGGIYVFQTNHGTFQIRNCIIEDNYAEGTGGGLYTFATEPIIDNCIIRNNVAFSGGGLYFMGSTPKITNSKFQNNIVSYINYSFQQGGGIYINGGSLSVSNSSFTNNLAGYDGAAVYSNVVTVFNNNTVSGNKAGYGGGLYLSTISYCFNNLFYNNKATVNGGAIYMYYNAGESEFINNTVVHNTAGNSGGGLMLFQSNTNFTNCIIRNNTSQLGPQIKAVNNAGSWAPDFRYCNIQGGLAGIDAFGNPMIYDNNVDVNPLFVNVSAGNFRLKGISPLINAGSTAHIPSAFPAYEDLSINFPSTDLDGFPRFVGNIDIGAFEFGSSLDTEEIDKDRFTIYPNPSSGIFSITSSTNIDSYKIYDIQGKELFQRFAAVGISTIDLSNYPRGLYFVQFLASDKTFTRKILKN